MLTRALTILALVLAACSGQKPRLLHPSDPSTDFYTVSPGIYRGGRLDEGGVLRLQKLGIKTIINLENDDEQIALEAKWAKAAAITQISSPMSGYYTPDDAQVDRILKLLADPTKRPVYIHCMKGMDRTGVVVALHRVYNEGWTRARAEEERDAIGFNHWLGNLDRYYGWKAVRYKPAPRAMIAAAASGGAPAKVAAHAAP
ncbi:MAG: tyrosine-protein phosphatase [Deltaproteobacteria bacterium]|nr:tyrosine-protein phosphatase [Deltaproteobacteria bacterium]